jgi:hypothetical protein
MLNTVVITNDHSFLLNLTKALALPDFSVEALDPGLVPDQAPLAATKLA